MMAAQNSDIVTRLNRILSGADERGLDETECRAIRDVTTEIERLRKELQECENLLDEYRRADTDRYRWDHYNA